MMVPWLIAMPRRVVITIMPLLRLKASQRDFIFHVLIIILFQFHVYLCAYKYCLNFHVNKRNKPTTVSCARFTVHWRHHQLLLRGKSCGNAFSGSLP
jgi:hypothetical protein